MANTITIRGRLINHDGETHGDVHIDTETGLIVDVTNVGNEKPDLDAGDSLIFPGFGDLHVHAREDASGTQTYKEDYVTASQAAINGGVTFFLDMPNNPTAPIDDATYAEKEKLTARSLVPVVLYAGIGPTTSPLARNVPYKAFMGPSVGSLFFDSNEKLPVTLERYKGKPISFHCEDPELLKTSEGAPTHEERRPREAEVKATEFALELIKKYELQGRLCHYSTREGIEKLITAKREGLNVTAETTPHHLYFDDSMFTPPDKAGLNKNLHKWLQVNPPIRKREDRIAMIEALRNGDIDYLGTDHAPHSIEEKEKGTSGMPHLDTYGAFTTWLMKECGFTPQDIARVCSYNPGKFVKQFLPEKFGKGFGKIEAGYMGSLTIIDPKAPFLVERSKLKTKCGWSPFEGVEFPGQVVYTVVAGRIHTTSLPE